MHFATNAALNDRRFGTALPVVTVAVAFTLSIAGTFDTLPLRGTPTTPRPSQTLNPVPHPPPRQNLPPNLPPTALLSARPTAPAPVGAVAARLAPIATKPAVAAVPPAEGLALQPRPELAMPKAPVGDLPRAGLVVPSRRAAAVQPEPSEPRLAAAAAPELAATAAAVLPQPGALAAARPIAPAVKPAAAVAPAAVTVGRPANPSLPRQESAALLARPDDGPMPTSLAGLVALRREQLRRETPPTREELRPVTGMVSPAALRWILEGTAPENPGPGFEPSTQVARGAAPAQQARPGAQRSTIAEAMAEPPPSRPTASPDQAAPQIPDHLAQASQAAPVTAAEDYAQILANVKAASRSRPAAKAPVERPADTGKVAQDEAIVDKIETPPVRQAAAGGRTAPVYRQTAAGIEIDMPLTVGGVGHGTATLLIEGARAGQEGTVHDAFLVRLADVIDAVRPAMDPDEYQRLRGAPSADAFVSLNRLREAGIAVQFDRRGGIALR